MGLSLDAEILTNHRHRPRGFSARVFEGRRGEGLFSISRSSHYIVIVAAGSTQSTNFHSLDQLGLTRLIATRTERLSWVNLGCGSHDFLFASPPSFFERWLNDDIGIRLDNPGHAPPCGWYVSGNK